MCVHKEFQNVSEYNCNALDLIFFLILTMLNYISSSAYIHSSMYANVKLCGATPVFLAGASLILDIHVMVN